jgi:hypothetical protein
MNIADSFPGIHARVVVLTFIAAALTIFGQDN